MKKLPKKPSDLLTLGLECESKAHNSDLYKVDMSRWHSGFTDSGLPREKCRVCLGGAVMAFVLDAPRHSRPTIGGRYGITNKLYALNGFRTGSIHYALSEMCNKAGKLPKDFRNVDVPEYLPKTRLSWRAAMRRIVKRLAALGL